MNILGIDGGLGASGSPTACVLLHDRGGAYDILARVEFAPQRGDWVARKDAILRDLDEWLDGRDVDLLAIEDTYLGSNAQTRHVLDLLIGGIIAVAMRKHAIACVTVSNVEAKLALLGHTDADGDAVARHANREFAGQLDEPLSEHEAFAIAVAIHAASAERERRLLERVE